MNCLKLPIAIILLTFLQSCDAQMGKTSPEYTGVNLKLAPYINEYLYLAKLHGITFNNTVTAGFKKIEEYGVVGICNWGLNFREIDIDIRYYKNMTEIQKYLTIWHESNHCYCHRQHDYYPPRGPHNNYIKNYNSAINDPANRDGFFNDRCPISIMFPSILDSDCFVKHYSEYTEELFRGCIPY